MAIKLIFIVCAMVWLPVALCMWDHIYSLEAVDLMASTKDELRDAMGVPEDSFPEVLLRLSSMALKGRSLSLEQRLRLLLYTWRSPDIHDPNKQQVLIDLLTGYLLNRKKHELSDADTGRIWRCLQAVLQTRTGHVAPTLGQGLSIKHSIVQVLLEALSGLCDSEDDSCGTLSSVIGCCHAIVTSPVLSYVLVARLDHMISLLAALCRLLTIHRCDDTRSAALATLLHDVAAKYSKSQKTAHNQRQLLTLACDKLLADLVVAWAAYRQYTTGSHATVAADLHHIMEQTLFHRDHHGSYSAYLGYSPDGETQLTKKAKTVEHVYRTLVKLLSQPSTMTETCTYLPMLFDAFLNTNCHGGSATVARHMFVKLLGLIGVQEPGTSPAQSGSGVNDGPPAETLSTLCPMPLVASTLKELLQTTQKYAVYNAASDTGEGTPQLTLYRHIVRILLANKCVTSDWYQCFTVLLSMDHQILETSLTEIVTALWIDAPEQPPDRVLGTLDGFLRDLLTTYHKLRQVPRLIVRCLDGLTASRSPGALLLPPCMLNRYGEIIQSLPQATTTDIWHKFVSHLKQRYVAPGDRDVSGQFQGVCSLFYHYLLHVKVTDYSITSTTSTQVQQLMVAMETDILVPLLTTGPPDNSMLCATLQLCHGWGQVTTMLAVYTPHRAGSDTAGASRGRPGDLGPLHKYLEPRAWAAIYKRVLAAQDPKLLYVWDMLTAQQLRASISLCPDSGHEELRSVLDKFLRSTDLDTVSPHTSWGGLVESVTSENYPVARWQLTVFHLVYLHGAMTRSQIRDVARLLVKTSQLQASKDGITGTTIMKTSRAALTSEWFRESPALQTEVVSCLWAAVIETLYSHVPSPKKRKISLHVSLTREILVVLSSGTESSTGANSSIEDLQQTAGKLSDLLQQTTHDEPPLTPGYTRLEDTLQLLQWLPLEHMAPVDQIRCMVGLLTLMSSLCLHKHAECERLMSECVDYLLVLLESAGSASFFHLLDVTIYLHWLRDLPDMGESNHGGALYQKIILLIEMSCTTIVRDFSLLANLSPVVDKLCHTLALDVGPVREGTILQALFLLQECTRLARRPYLNENLKAVCVSLLCTLSSAVLPFLSLVSNHGNLHIAAHVVRCSSIILDASTVGGVNSDDRATLLNTFPVLFEWCIGVLPYTKTGVSQYHRMAALMFLHSVTRHHTLLADALTSTIKLRLWTALYDWLQQFLGDQSELVDVANRARSKDEHKHSPDKPPADVKTLLNGNPAVSVDHVMSVIQGHHHSVHDSKCRDQFTERTCDFSKMAAESSGMSQHFSSVISLYKSLVFGGEFETGGSKVILKQVQAVMATLVLSYDVDDFSQLVNRLVDDVCPGTSADSVGKLQSAVYVWRRLLHLSFSPEQARVMVTAAQNMMLSSVSVLQQLHHSRDPTNITDIAVPVVTAQVQMVSLGPSLMCPQTAIMGLYACQHVPLDVCVRAYVPALHALSDLLDALLIHHTDTVFQNIPAFIDAAKHLLLSVVDQSSQDKIADDKDATQQLIGCAYQMERLFSLVSSHKVEFSKVAIYVVSDYVTRIQRATLLPAVKRALVPAVYKMLDLCDSHAVAQLRTVLSHGVCQIFQLLYNDYTRYHKYTGKV